MSRVLEGIKVVEVSMWAYVPSAGATLADWGAEVVKIEGPDGDPMRGLTTSATEVRGPDYLWEVWNRNKSGIAMDLKHPTAQQAVWDMVAEADVFLTSILPPARKRLGIDLETIRAKNPDIIYAAGTGTGPAGPDSTKGGYDSISFWSRGGVSAAVTPPGEPPLGMPSGAFGDSMSGVALAGGIAAALVRRSRTGEGCVVEGSLLGTAMWTMQQAIVGAYQAGLPMLPKPSSRQKPFNALVNSYRTSDGHWLSLCMLQRDVYWDGLLTAIGREDLLADPRYATPEDRTTYVSDIVAELDQTFASQPLEHWKTVLRTQPGQWDVFQEPADLVTDPQAVANGFVQTVEYPGGSLPLVAAPALFDREAPDLRPAPEFSGDADRILKSIGWDDERILQAKIEGAVV